MNKVAIVYWSGTGNTQAMAEAVAKGAEGAGAEAALLTADLFDPSAISNYDAFAFGCPAMGDEVLEEDEFQPMWDSCAAALKGSKVALFGSYGWGDGEWMRNWEDECSALGISPVCESVLCNETPDDEGIDKCQKLGAALAN